MIRHIWFDFSNTISKIKKDLHDRMRYESYAEVVGRPISPELVAEYEDLYKKHQNSNSDVFKSLGLPAGYWSERINSVPPETFYSLMADNIPEVLEKLSKVVPISIYSNLDLDRIMPALHVDPKIFTHILSSRMVGKPKPALDGFYKIIELSGLPPEEILYIGDHVGKEVLPAKKVGLKAGLMWNYSPEADYSFRDFTEILNLFESN